MDTFLIKATQLILALAFLIIIHEFGHFLFARLFGTRVEKFYIFFDPLTEIFKWKPGKYYGFFGSHHWLKGATEEDKKEYYARLQTEKEQKEREKREKELKKQGKLSADSKPEAEAAALTVESVEVAESATPAASDAASLPAKKKRRSFWKDTEYGIGWIPLGGYCRIAGMIDESMDTEQMKRPAQDWEFRSKPAWQRLLIMIGGVLFNFLLAILIYAGLVYATGEKYVPFERSSQGMYYSPEAQKAGFRDGDVPLAADGKQLDYPADALLDIMQAEKVSVLRNGADTVTLTMPEKFMFRIQEEAEKGELPFTMMTYRFPTRITQVMPGEGAAKAGVREGDMIIR